ncbi:hypothetical protein [Microbacterium soli]|uniref:Extradiol ring-cleavage dioxygenase LigAB LigA subunit domain-containing protein n=1 Tax=Microbacterium soli TaxID=446075 RepID=A0ABP7N4M5_9MICO
MSDYMIGKFIRSVEMDDAVLARYIADPAAYVREWLAGGSGPEAATDDRILSPEEQAAFAARDYGALFRLGAHPYLLWHFTEAIYEHEYTEGFGWRELVERYRAAIAPAGGPSA